MTRCSSSRISREVTRPPASASRSPPFRALHPRQQARRLLGRQPTGCGLEHERPGAREADRRALLAQLLEHDIPHFRSRSSSARAWPPWRRSRLPAPGPKSCSWASASHTSRNLLGVEVVVLGLPGLLAPALPARRRAAAPRAPARPGREPRRPRASAGRTPHRAPRARLAPRSSGRGRRSPSGQPSRPARARRRPGRGTARRPPGRRRGETTPTSPPPPASRPCA